MSVENVITNVLLFTALIGLAFKCVVFSTTLPRLFKNFGKKAFFIAALVFCDILLSCALILVVNGVIEKL